MADDGRESIAWAESPLQLLCAAEYAASIPQPIAVAFRLSGPQMTVTAAELLRRGAPFSSCEPYAGIPWMRLQQHRHWVVGDPFSGQFRAAVSVRPPAELTVVDDGDSTIRFARALAGTQPLARDGVAESRVATTLGLTALVRMQRLVERRRLSIFTTFADDAELRRRAADGIAVEPNRFGWLRRHAEPVELPADRVMLGTARVADGTLDADRYLAWVAREAATGPAAGAAGDVRVAYLPHRREPISVIRRIAELPGVRVVDTRLPVELALAGAARPLDIVAYRTSAVRTLRHVLAGTGSRIRSTGREAA